MTKIGFILVVLSLPVMAKQTVKIDSLFPEDGVLYLSYHVDDLIDEKSSDVLERGIASEVVHHIQLWKDKNFINTVEQPFFQTFKIVYDRWEKKYRIDTEDETRLTSHLETVIQKSTQLTRFPVTTLDKLEADQKYFVSINVTFQPISSESYNAISDIFSSEDSKERQTKGKKSDGFVSVLVNLLGFGDKEVLAKSKEFILTKDGKLEFVR